MADYIDRQAALKALEEICYTLWEIDIPSPTVPEYIEHHEQVQSVLKLAEKWGRELRDMPAADVVEVVRCNDCKWYKTNFSWNGKEHKVCVIEPYEPVRKGDDFCSRGERKDG